MLVVTNQHAIKHGIEVDSVVDIECIVPVSYTHLIQRFMLMESIEPQKKELLDNVPALVSTTEAIQAGKEVGLSERSVMYMFVNLTTVSYTHL